MGHQLVVSEANAGHSVLAGTLSFRAQFSPAPTTGNLADSWTIPFEHSIPIRRPTAYKGQRNFAGLWWCATNQRHVGFESWCERDQLMRLDFDPDIKGVASQPFRITLPPLLPQTSHVPDYFLRKADGTAIVIDVRPDALVKPADEEVFGATAALCASVGWKYQRLGELNSVYAANLRWIAGYRHPRCYREEFVTGLLARLYTTGTESIRELSSAIGDPICVLPTLFHLMWRHQITAELMTTPLHLETIINKAGTP